MEAKDLRIGNLVNHTDNPSTWVMTIETVAAEGCHTECNGIFEYIEPELLDPIPLTEEWLIKFGFKKINGYGYRKPNFKGSIWSNPAIWKYNDFMVDVKHVHQIQNLHFALTGKELTIKN